MTNAVIVKKGSKLLDGTEIIDIPVRYIDNGDGTYSEASSGGGGGAGDASAANQVITNSKLDVLITSSANTQAELAISDIYYTALISFTGATAGDSILVRKTVDITQVPSVETYSAWQNLTTGLNLVGTPTIGVQVGYVSTTPIAGSGLATVAKQDAILAKLQDLIGRQIILIGAIRTLAIGVTAVTSTPVVSTTKSIILTSNIPCWITIGYDGLSPPVAGSVGMYLPANIPSYPIFTTPSNTVVSVISATTGTGVLNIIECSQ